MVVGVLDGCLRLKKRVSETKALDKGQGVREAEGCEIHQPWRGPGGGGILMRN